MVWLLSVNLLNSILLPHFNRLGKIGDYFFLWNILESPATRKKTPIIALPILQALPFKNTKILGGLTEQTMRANPIIKNNMISIFSRSIFILAAPLKLQSIKLGICYFFGSSINTQLIQQRTILENMLLHPLRLFCKDCRILPHK